MMKRILLFLACVLMLCSCQNQKMKAEQSDPLDSGRFELEYSQRNQWGGKILILRDSETGAKYLFVRDGYAGGLTELK